MFRLIRNLFILIFASILLTISNQFNYYIKDTKSIEVFDNELGFNEEDITYLKSIYSNEQLKLIKDLNISRDNLFKYLSIETFSINSIKEIENIRLTNNISHLAAVNLNNHPNIMSNFYEDISSSIYIENYLILVNKNYQLNDDYIPPNLVYTRDIRQLVDDKNRYYLQKEAYYALNSLFQEAYENDLILYMSNGYRSYQKQERIYNEYLLDGGNADLFSARPGHSEHQTGLAVDITCKSAGYELSEKFAFTKEGTFIKHNAHRFGFIERYPKSKEHLTGYQYEPWHLRYVGIEAANIIYHNNLTLEEYLVNYTVIPKK